ncbi:hypothetical protein HDU91_002569, partial [Kappamyces sp. JEL0680]
PSPIVSTFYQWSEYVEYWILFTFLVNLSLINLLLVSLCRQMQSLTTWKAFQRLYVLDRYCGVGSLVNLLASLLYVCFVVVRHSTLLGSDRALGACNAFQTGLICIHGLLNEVLRGRTFKLFQLLRKPLEVQALIMTSPIASSKDGQTGYSSSASIPV